MLLQQTTDSPVTIQVVTSYSLRNLALNLVLVQLQWYAPIKIIGIKIIVPIKCEKSFIKIDGSSF
jgi:hypothetical protein